MAKITHAVLKIITSEPGEPEELHDLAEKTKLVWFPLSSTEGEIGKLLAKNKCRGCYSIDGYDPESGKVADAALYSCHPGVSFREIKEAVDVIKEHFAQQE